AGGPLDPDARLVASDDAYVVSSAPTTSLGSEQDLATGAAGASGGRHRAFVRFELPSGVGPIVSATLRARRSTGYVPAALVHDLHFVADDDWGRVVRLASDGTLEPLAEPGDPADFAGLLVVRAPC